MSTRDLELDLEIDENNLDREFSMYPAILNYWARMYAQAEYEADFAHQAFKVRYAEVYGEKKSNNRGTSSSTVKDMENLANLDPRVQAAQTADMVAKRNAGMARGAFEAIKSKLNCLISMGAKERVQMNQEPNIRVMSSNTPSHHIPDRTAYMKK